MHVEKMKYLAVPAMDHVLVIFVKHLVLVKMAVHILLLILAPVIIDVPVHYSTRDITVKVYCYFNSVHAHMCMWLSVLILEVYPSGPEPVNYVYLPFLNLSGDGVLTLPPVLDGSYPITLPEPLPLSVGENVTTHTTAYIS